MTSYLEGDWYPGGIPSAVRIGPDVYLDSSYAFASCHSTRDPAVQLGAATGAYDRATFVVGPAGQIVVGAYTCLNGTYLICHDRISIGDHCFLAWGVVITDSAASGVNDVANRREVLARVGDSAKRIHPCFGRPAPVIIEDNVWVGFGAVILPGVRLGRGSVIGCKTVVDRDVSPYHVVAGQPMRTVRRLEADDTDEVRLRAMEERRRE